MHTSCAHFLCRRPQEPPWLRDIAPCTLLGWLWCCWSCHRQVDPVPAAPRFQTCGSGPARRGCRPPGENVGGPASELNSRGTGVDWSARMLEFVAERWGSSFLGSGAGSRWWRLVRDTLYRAGGSALGGPAQFMRQPGRGGRGRAVGAHYMQHQAAPCTAMYGASPRRTAGSSSPLAFQL